MDEFYIARTYTEYRIIVRTLSNHGRRTGKKAVRRKQGVRKKKFSYTGLFYLDKVS